MKAKRMRVLELGRQISAARAKAGLTQVALAAAAGVAPMTVSRYERGEMEPGALTLGAIATACGISADWLLGHRPARPA